VKQYGKDKRGFDVCIGADRQVSSGDPRFSHICTSHVERANLNMRMSMRRFTRLSNGFSKKVENHAAMVAIHFLNYNLMRNHKSLGTAPAVAAEVIEKPITMHQMVDLFDDFRDQHYPIQRPLRYKKKRDTPKTYAPEIPKTPWYLDPESGGPNPPEGNGNHGSSMRAGNFQSGPLPIDSALHTL
jgi:hypothetical protein